VGRRIAAPLVRDDAGRDAQCLEDFRSAHAVGANELVELRLRHFDAAQIEEQPILIDSDGAVREACRLVRDQVLAKAGTERWEDVELAAVLGDEYVEATTEWRHRPTEEVDPETGQGFAHVQYAFAAHRAVVDVDVELGLVKVVELACTQDVGHAVNPQAVAGQIHGGTAQGMGLALMEEVVVTDGIIRNPSFTDYLIPTILDMPPMQVDILELPDPHAPYGLRGVGEPPTISSGPAVLAAVRAATGLPLTRVPIRPEHICGTRP